MCNESALYKKVRCSISFR